MLGNRTGILSGKSRIGRPALSVYDNVPAIIGRPVKIKGFVLFAHAAPHMPADELLDGQFKFAGTVRFIYKSECRV